MIPILFSIGSLNFYTHGVFAVAGICLGATAAYLLARPKLDCSYFVDNIIYTIFAGIAGARLTYFILYADQFSNWRQIFYFWEGGLVSYGGFIAGGITFFLLNRLLRQPAMEWLDALAVGFPLGLAIGRAGEFLGGENFGVASNSPLAIDRRMPIHLFEAVWCGLVFLLLWIIYRQNRSLKPGAVLAASIIFYTLGRFVIDFWREDSNIILNLSLSQVASLTLLMFVSGILLFLTRGKRKGAYASDR